MKISDTWPQRKDFGEATANIYLLDGDVSIKNDNGVVLLEGEAADGFWERLWIFLEGDLKVSHRAQPADFE